MLLNRTFEAYFHHSYWLIVHCLLLTLGFVASFSLTALQAQQYTFPVNPGKTAYLAGNVGEVRGSHLHAGLDIVALVGTPVYASADGYVSRIGVSSYGYGKVLYLTHPTTGHQTVYGHLDGFAASVADYVVAKHYALRENILDLTLKPDELPVKQGQIIAYVGNTGASAGAHLHYEIRTLDDVVLNPARVGGFQKELPKDKLPPVITYIAITPLSVDARVQGQFETLTLPVRGKGKGKFVLDKPIDIWGEVGISIVTYDVANNASNTYATTNIELLVDGKSHFRADLNRIPLNQGRSALVHMDYPLNRRTGQGFQRCYVANGNEMTDNYRVADALKGRIALRDKRSRQIVLKASDTYGNESTLSLSLQGAPPVAQPKFSPAQSPLKPQLQYSIVGNILKIEGQNLKQGGEKAQLYFFGTPLDLPLAYTKQQTSVYLWNLAHGLPEEIAVGPIRIPTYFKMLVPSQTSAFYADDELEISFEPQTLFDTLYLEVERRAEGWRINAPEIPLRTHIQVGLRKHTLQPKQAAYYLSGGSSAMQRSYNQEGILTFDTRVLGTFDLLTDKTPPKITLHQRSPQQISFKISDDLSGIKSYQATIDGQYVLLDYEHKQKLLKTALPPNIQRLKGNFVLTVTDEVGNQQTYTTDF
ncbi:M23 family metallopeptidase [Eisenibacter elegans]|uniref:M23 family metallopeptidase n=1 Tax=Eisenibacter elegans TaxID=997 RepID=UPI0004176773|nr:M23 family metallopeptidase [Eisenibacter elegans]